MTELKNENAQYLPDFGGNREDTKRKLNNFWNSRETKAKVDEFNDEDEDIEILDVNRNTSYLFDKHATDLQIIGYNFRAKRAHLAEQLPDRMMSLNSINKSDDHLEDKTNSSQDEKERLLDD